jgi:hypothetical protein
MFNGVPRLWGEVQDFPMMFCNFVIEKWVSFAGLSLWYQWKPHFLLRQNNKTVIAESSWPFQRSFFERWRERESSALIAFIISPIFSFFSHQDPFTSFHQQLPTAQSYHQSIHLVTTLQKIVISFSLISAKSLRSPLMYKWIASFDMFLVKEMKHQSEFFSLEI